MSAALSASFKKNYNLNILSNKAIKNVYIVQEIICRYI